MLGSKLAGGSRVMSFLITMNRKLGKILMKTDFQLAHQIHSL
jgi:hypothetical protein